jgi:hypothetical protein
VKTTIWVFSALAAGVLAVSGLGCKKQASSAQPGTLEDGVAQLRAALVNSSPQVQSNLYNGVVYNIRYEKYVNVLMALDSIASDPSLTDPQKKAVSNLIEQVKPLVVKAPAQ